ncbi:MAG: hypothetical protein MPJ25_16370, partial [Pirellulales bacterium]|nr:hypothetical protein [Pirellulales bacterium]
MSSLVFNLSRDSLITGANVIDGQIFWTDDRNEPRGINISKFRDADHSSGTTRFAGVDFINTDITVIKPHPFQALSSPTLTTDATSDTLPFEDVFPRFSYRWRYDDGQFSPYAPFTNPIWVSDTFSPRNNYEETLNNAMRNIITRIVFSNVPRGDRNVVAIDLLYNESTSSAVYVYETREILPANRGSGSESFTIDNRNAFRTLPPNQLTRHFDNVPRFAKAQEITGNRLLYANYVQGYNQGPTELGDNGFQCTPSIVNIPVTGDTITNRFQSRQSVKAGRTYQIGVAYIDPVSYTHL